MKNLKDEIDKNKKEEISDVSKAGIMLILMIAGLWFITWMGQS